MAHFHIKKKNGRPYLYVREIARVDGKPRVVSQTYIGSPEKVAQLAKGKESDVFRLSVKEFGALWIANLTDKDIDLCSIVNEIIPANSKEKGPSVGDYFLYATLNRMVEPKSKRALPEWYDSTDIQHIRPVDIKSLNSERYWAKWDRVSKEDIEKIGKKFFSRIWEIEDPDADCVLFDTTNYYTFMSSNTESELAKRGKNKEGRNNLRQVGLGLLVDRKTKLPIFYSAYPGNLHDSKEFERIMDEMFGVITGFNDTKKRLTIVFDKGMNSEENMNRIDEHPNVGFITSYSPYFADELASTPLDKFELIDTVTNRSLSETGNDDDQILAYRTTDEFWGKMRTVVVTYYPPTARKQCGVFLTKLDQMQQELSNMCAKISAKTPKWSNADEIKKRYLKLCKRMHISSDYFELNFVGDSDKTFSLRFVRNSSHIDHKLTTLGKSVIVTDNVDWTTAEIVEANLDRWRVEDNFRLSKNDEIVSTRPLRHWTDSKIRCHLFTCVVALTYLRRLELKLIKNGIRRTAADVMADLHKLHSVITLGNGRLSKRTLEQPSPSQMEIIKALGYEINQNGVLQPLSH